MGCISNVADFVLHFTNKIKEISVDNEIKKSLIIKIVLELNPTFGKNSFNIIRFKLGKYNKDDFLIKIIEDVLNRNKSTEINEQEWENKLALIEDRTPDSVSLERKNIKDWFINNSVIYSQIQADFNLTLVSNLILLSKPLKDSVATIQNYLWDSIYKYIQKEDATFANSLPKKVYEKDIKTNKYNYLGQLTLENVTKIKKLITLNYKLKLDDLYDLEKTNPELYRALKALATLWGFDYFIKQAFGKSIRIKDNLGKFTTLDKYEINVQNNQSSTWRTSEDILYEEDLSELLKTLITTIPIYGKDGTKISNMYLTMAKFNRIIASIRNIRHKLDLILFDSADVFADAARNLTNLLKNYLKSEGLASIHSLVAHMRLNPEMDVDILLTILFTNSSVLNIPYYKIYDYIPSDIVLAFSSLKRKLIDGNFSYKNSKSDLNVYFYVTRVMAVTSVLNYTLEFFEEDTERVKEISLGDMYDRTRSMLEEMVNGRFPSKRTWNYDKLSQLYTLEKSKFNDKECVKVTLGNVTLFLNNKTKSTSTLMAFLIDGERHGTKNGLEMLKEYIPKIFKDWTGYPVDESFFEAYENISDDYYTLLDFASTIMLSAYLRYQSGETVEKFFSPEIAAGRRLILSTNTKSIIPKSFFTILNTIALAYDISKGNNSKSAGSDSKGNSIGLFSPSRLFEGFDFINRFVINKGVLSNMSIRKGLLRDLVPFREFKGQKNSIEFTPNEVYYNSFVINFLGKLLDKDSTSIGTHPYVIADKSIVLYGDINYTKLRALLGNYSSNIDLFTPEVLSRIHLTIKAEFGEIYKSLYNDVVNTWKLAESKIRLKDPSIIIDPENDFVGFNTWLRDNNMSIYDFNSKYAEDLLGIELFEELHYVLDKNSRVRLNRTLLSLYCRFNDILPSSISSSFASLKIPTYNEFTKYLELALVRDLLTNNTKLKIPGYYVLQFDKNDKFIGGLIARDWIVGDYLIIAKNKKKVLNKGKWLEVEVPIYTLDDFYEARNNNTLVVNPYLKTYNWVHYFLSLEISLATAGTYLVNPAKGSSRKYDSDEWDAFEEENERYTTATKRKVGMSGNMDLFIPCRKGLPRTIKIATIEEASTPMFNYVGDTGKANVQDGMTYLDGIAKELQDISLGSLADTGDVGKPLSLSINARTGSLVLVKTATQALTARNQRESHSNRMVAANMEDSYLFPENTDITINDEGKPIVYECYYRSFLDTGEVYYKVTNLKKKIGDKYSYDLIRVDIHGNEIAQAEPREAYISTIYDLYLLLGAENSVSFNGEELTYKLNKDLAANKTIAIVLGQKLSLKDCLIYWAPTSGAIKCGAANINPKAVLNKRTKLATQEFLLGNSGTLLDKTHEAEGAHISILTLVMNALSARGYTLEKAREVYEVVHNICLNAAMDFIEIADEVYKENLKSESKEQSQDTQKLQLVEQFKLLLADTVIDRLVSGSTDYVALLAQWFTDLNDRGLVTFKDKSLPLSMNSVYNQCIQTIASSVSKIGIKLKFNGLLAVLCPSHGIYRLFGNKTLGEFKGYTDLKRTWDLFVAGLNADSIPTALNSGQIIPSYKLALGITYAVFDLNGELVYEMEDATDAAGNIMYLPDGVTPIKIRTKPLLVTIREPLDYINTRQKYGDYYFKENWYTLTENAEIKKGEYYIQKGKVKRFTALEEVNGIRVSTITGTKFEPQGRDLKPYNCYFIANTLNNGVVTEETKGYCLWDLMAIKEMWDVKGDKKRTVAARKKFQEIVNALEHKQPITVQLLNGEYVKIIPNTIEVDPYENIYDSINLREFGIEPGTSLSEINEEFFYNLLQKRRTLTASDKNYDYAIRNLDGNHLYILNDNDSEVESKTKDLYQISEDRIAYIAKHNRSEVWVLDDNGNRLFQLTSDGNGNTTDIVYLDKGNNIIVRTKKVNELIENNSSRRDTLHISESNNLENIEFAYKGKKYNIKSLVYNVVKFKGTPEEINESKNNLIRGLLSGEISIDLIIEKAELENVEAVNKFKKAQELILAILNNGIRIERGTSERNEKRVDDLILLEAKEMFASFKVTLETIASRTPSQSMLSFMAMKTAAFNGTGVNNVCVSPYQLWLQGSDFDIDAASLLGYSISKNGKFNGWSLLFLYLSKNLLDTSFSLPFPTGKKCIVTNNWKLENRLTEVKKAFETLNKTKFITSEKLESMEEKIQESLITMSWFIREVNKNGFPRIEDTEFAQLLLEMVDKHNTYFINSRGLTKTKLLLNAANNFISRGIYEIIKSPANVILAQAPIDIYADVAKEIGRGIRDLDLPVFKKTTKFENTTIKGVSIIKVNKPWRDNPNLSNSTYRIYLDSRLGKLKDSRFKLELIVSDTDTIYYPNKVLIKDGNTVTVNELEDLNDIPYFELVIDLEAGNYSVHFKAKRNELTSLEKETLFLALAVLIPEGGNVSTYGTLTKGGKMGVIRLGKLIGNKVIDIRQVKEKFEANESKYANLPGNSFNLGVEQSTNSTGKKCIEITAAAMKALEAAINATNLTILDITEVTASNKKYIMSQFDLLGRNYQIIANAYGNNTGKTALEIISAARNDIDSLLELSVLLTLSTDNAKELILSKIIALEETMSLYVAGVAYGLSIGELSLVMVSKSMKSLIKVMKPNFFDRYDGYNRFSAIIKYVNGYLGLSLADCKELTKIKGLSDSISKCFIGEDGEVPSISFISLVSSGNELVDMMEGGISVSNEFLSSLPNLTPENLLKFKKVIIEYLNNKDAANSIGLLLRILDWINIKYTIITDTITVIDPTAVTSEGVDGSKVIKLIPVWDLLVKLSMIGDLFTELASICSINKEIKTKPEELLSYLYRFENLVESQKRRRGINNQESSFKIDLSKFIREESYRQEVFNKYDEYLGTEEEKIGINIPYIIANNIQYMGYLRDCEALVTGYREGITRFKITEDLFESIKSEIPFDKVERAIKNIGREVNSFVINLWLRTLPDFIVPKGTNLKCLGIDGKLDRQSIPALAEVPITLGTSWGNRTFRNFVDEILIPSLLSGDTTELLGVDDPSISNNLFIKNLSLVADPNTVSGNARYEYSFFIELNRLDNPYDADTFKLYLRALLKLKAYSYNGYSLYEIFYIYGLIVFDDFASKYNYLPMFNDDVANRSSELINSYINYWKWFDSDSNISKYLDTYLILIEIAPAGKRYDNKLTKVFTSEGWLVSNGATVGKNPKVPRISAKVNTPIWLSPNIQILLSLDRESSKLKLKELIYKGTSVKDAKKIPIEDILFMKTLKTKVYKWDKEKQAQSEEFYYKVVGEEIDTQLTLEAIERLFNDPCK